jgi:XTP/dITP diphosphohydrolase/tetrapyrrole methylase family protein/MazG family protein
MPEKIYEQEFVPGEGECEAYADFSAVVRQLRRDCPWDREQTHESVKHLLIEEAYEAVSAIDAESWDDLEEELGDLLLHVLFHSVIAEGEGRFTMSDVLRVETEKLVRRHPHVFGEVRVEDVDEVLRNWEQIKMQEGTKSALEGVPRHLPALLRAYRIQQKAAGIGFDFPDRDDAWEKVVEEMHEFADTRGASPAEKEREFGDLLFALVNYARFNDINPENALSRTNDRFARRFSYVERRLAESDRTPADADLDEMDAYWEEAKDMEEG